MNFSGAAKNLIPAVLVVAIATPAVAAGGKKSGAHAIALGGGQMAGGLAAEIVTPIIAEQIMQAFGISSGTDSIDYGRIRSIVEDVVSDQNKKQTMGRLLGELGGVNKTVGDILRYARADKKQTIEPSSNDEQVQRLIAGMWTPLNNVLSEFEGNYTGESHSLIEPYASASHLKASLAGLQLMRANRDIAAFQNMLKKVSAKKKGLAKRYRQAIKDRKQAARGHAMVYADQSAAAIDFLHQLMFDDRQAMAKIYIKRNIDDMCGTLIPQFRDRANYDPYDPTGGTKYPFGAVRYKLRNDAIKKPFPRFRKNSLVTVKMQVAAQIGKEEFRRYKSKSVCRAQLGFYTKNAIPNAVFHQTVLRYPVMEISKMLEKQRDTAVKLAKRYKFKAPKFGSKARTANLKSGKGYVLHKGKYVWHADR